MTGTIKNLTTEKGFGFILAEDKKEYFFHRSGLRGVKYDDLEKGDAVEFTPTSGQKGLRAEEIALRS